MSDHNTELLPASVFYSYSDADREFQQKLEKHLSSLRRQGFISEWHHHRVAPGTEKETSINHYLDNASLILLLISPDFLASDYCYSVEMQRALEKQKAGTARVIPIVLRAVDSIGEPFALLQCLPQNRVPVTMWSNEDAALQDVAQGIRIALTDSSQFPLFSSFLPTQQPIWNLPYRRNPFFTGRKELLIQLHDRLVSAKVSALTQPQAVSGLGGIGKTQVALEYAYRYQNEYQFVFWVRAATRDTLISDIVAIAALIHLPEKDERDQMKIVTAVKQWLARNDRWLLILDNADDVTILSDFLPVEERGHVLLTTRAQVVGAFAQSLAVEKMGLAEGTLLLLRRAKAIEEDAFLDQATEESLSLAETIVIAVDFLPLALDQVGAYVEETGCGLSDYWDLYQTRRQELLKRRGLSQDHPEPVATTWSLSFQKVEQANPAAADLLRFCAFLDPDFIPEELISQGASHLSPLLRRAATDMLELNRAIEDLRKFSLVQRNAAQKTLSIHRLVQEVLKSEMKKGTPRRWSERTVRAVYSVFPASNLPKSSQGQRYLSQAQLCVTFIQQYKFTFEAAVQLLMRTASYLQDYGLYTQAEALYRRALQVREKELGPVHPDVAECVNHLANIYYLQGKYNEIEPLYQQALQIRERTLERDQLNMAQNLNDLASLYYRQGKYAKAEPLYQQALQIRERILGPDHIDLAKSINNLAILYWLLGNLPEAEMLYQRALRMYEKTAGLEHPSTAECMNNLGELYRSQARYAEAEPLYQHALQIRKKVLGLENPGTADSLNSLGILYWNLHRYTRAEELYQQALQIYKRTLGPEHYRTAECQNNLALLLRELRRYEEAEALYQETLRIYKQTLGSDHLRIANLQNNLGLLYFDQKKYTEAESAYQHALQIYEKTVGLEHPDVGECLNNLGLLYTSQEKYVEAEQFYLQAIHLAEKSLGDDHPGTADGLYNLAELYVLQEKYKEAEPLFERALAIREQALGRQHPTTRETLEKYGMLLRTTGREEQAIALEIRFKED